jgi:hypothetical protein
MTGKSDITIDMTSDAMEVVRVLGWKTLAGAALRKRDAIVATNRAGLVMFEMPIGWYVKEVANV